jgi:hypothetical protein
VGGGICRHGYCVLNSYGNDAGGSNASPASCEGRDEIDGLDALGETELVDATGAYETRALVRLGRPNRGFGSFDGRELPIA